MDTTMEIRPYTPADRNACAAISDQDFPAPEGPFFVMEHEGQIVGCGGYRVEQEAGLATLVWQVVRKDVRGQGLGRYLTMYCLREIGKAGGIDRVRVEASRSVAGFYERQGFRAASTDGDRVELVKRLSVCS